MNEKSVYELLLIACNAYKAWWDCGRDFKDHADKFDAWEKALESIIKDIATPANFQSTATVLKEYIQALLDHRKTSDDTY